jgi:hypothetical protein
VLAAVAAVALLIGVLIVSLGQVGNEPVPPDVLPVPGLVVERKIFPQAEVLGRLRQELLSRTVQIRDVDVRLEAPDRIVIPGKVLAPTGSLVGVTIELQIAADAGKPKITPIRVSAVGIGISVPQAATDAVTKRADEANKELANQVPAGQTVRRLFIENNAIVVELEMPAAVGTGTPQAQTPKPGA